MQLIAISFSIKSYSCKHEFFLQSNELRIQSSCLRTVCNGHRHTCTICRNPPLSTTGRTFSCTLCELQIQLNSLLACYLKYVLKRLLKWPSSVNYRCFYKSMTMHEPYESSAVQPEEAAKWEPN